MPSNKVSAAVAGKAEQQRREIRLKTDRPRFSHAPDSFADARDQEDIIADSEASFADTPYRSGTLLSLTFTASSLTQEVPHNLNSALKGFIVADLIGNAAIYRDDETSAAPITFSRAKTCVKLTATGPCKAKVWVWI